MQKKYIPPLTLFFDSVDSQEIETVRYEVIHDLWLAVLNYKFCKFLLGSFDHCRNINSVNKIKYIQQSNDFNLTYTAQFKLLTLRYSLICSDKVQALEYERK